MNNQTKLKVYTQKTGAALGDMFGIFFEDLNHAADGGLYAELVQNRSFEFDPIDHPSYHALTAWDKVERGGGRAELTVESESPFHSKTRIMRLSRLSSRETVSACPMPALTPVFP